MPAPQDEHAGFGNWGTEGVQVVVPQGRFIISRMLEITQSNVVLKGAGVSGRAAERQASVAMPMPIAAG